MAPNPNSPLVKIEVAKAKITKELQEFVAASKSEITATKTEFEAKLKQFETAANNMAANPRNEEARA